MEIYLSVGSQVYFPFATSTFAAASSAIPSTTFPPDAHRACVGRLYFKITCGIAYGQHWLNVKFQNSVVRVSFRILTEDERKTLSKNDKSIEKQVKDAFKRKT